MSARLSPDGMYYWDGQAWRSTLSPDGRFRWNGSAWAAVAATALTPYPYAQPKREPTSWTRPLQYGVIGWYVWSILFSLSEPFWAGSTMTNIFNQSLQRQQQINPDVSPPPTEFLNAMTSVMTVTIWIVVVMYAAVFAVIIVGAWLRWTWIYYVVLALLGLTSLLLPVQIIDAFVAPAFASGLGINAAMPAWLYPLAVGTGFLAVGLFVWMLIALIRRGPWAMRRPQVY